MTAKNPKIATIDAFFAAYASHDIEGMRAALAENIEWTIPGHHPLAGTKHGVTEVAAFFTQLAKAGFQAETIYLEASEEYVVDIHRGFSTEGVGKVDTMWALVWHFDAEGRIDRVFNLCGDQAQMDLYVWNNFTLAPLPDRLG
jgi:ketosteroid isomerase-like protein